METSILHCLLLPPGVFVCEVSLLRVEVCYVILQVWPIPVLQHSHVHGQYGTVSPLPGSFVSSSLLNPAFNASVCHGAAGAGMRMVVEPLRGGDVGGHVGVRHAFLRVDTHSLSGCALLTSVLGKTLALRIRH